jgi:CBS domain containing-hemolysin-like protein
MPSNRKFKRLWSRIKGRVTSTDDLLEIIRQAHTEGILGTYIYAINEQIYKIAEKPVREVMIPRVDMVVVRDDMTAKEVIGIFKKHGYSKIPVVRKRVDDVVGILHMKELLKHLNQIDTLKAKDLCIRPFFVPESKKVVDTLSELQHRRISIALVVDEHGSLSGLLTLEDLLEEIVGEIWDEFDTEEILVRKLKDGEVLFNTKIELEEANEELGKELVAEDVHTLGGYIIAQLDRVPQVGETFTLDGIRFEVTEATQQRLKKVKARMLPQAEGDLKDAAQVDTRDKKLNNTRS